MRKSDKRKQKAEDRTFEVGSRPPRLSGSRWRAGNAEVGKTEKMADGGGKCQPLSFHL